MITRYRNYLEILDKKFAKMFEAQKPFIKCQKGCAYCCKEGEYPMSELEYVNIMFYYNELSDERKDKINENISKLLENPKQKMYECPFLINNECSVYPARALICRTFGLMSFYKDDRKKIPFCVELGLNYSDVCDNEKGMIVRLAEDGTEPVAYNIDRRTLRSREMEKGNDIFFGEDKSLIEWLAEGWEND